MIKKDKLFLVSSKLDDSVKSQAAIYDVTLFKSFLNLEKYINSIPVVIDSILITTEDLAFNNANMIRFINLLNSPFLTLTGNVMYLIDRTMDVKMVSEFFKSNVGSKVAVYQGDLSTKFIVNILSGEGRETVEGQVSLVTYRIRADEYIKQKNSLKYETDNEHYVTDEEDLADIPDEELPNDVNPEVNTTSSMYYVVGVNGFERTLFTFLLAQYTQLSHKTLIIDKDVDYHTLVDFVTKSNLEYCFIDITDLYSDITNTLTTIKSTKNNLIVVGSKKRVDYDYNFIFDLIYNNLKGYIDCFIRECTFDEVPYGKNYIVVTGNTVPKVLESCNAFKYPVTPSQVSFIGLQVGTLGAADITSNEMASIIAQVLSKDNILAQVLHVGGVNLRTEEVIYDIFSIITRKN